MTSVSDYFPAFYNTKMHVPFSHALATVGVNQLHVFGPEVTDDLSRILLVPRANSEI